MTLSEDDRLIRFIAPAVVASVAIHALVLILIGMAGRFIPDVFEPAWPKVITVDLVTECPGTVAPEPKKVLPPKLDPSVQIDPPKPEEVPPASPKKKRIARHPPAPAALSIPCNVSEISNSPPAKDKMAAFPVSPSEDDGKVISADAVVSTGPEEGGKTVGLASALTGKEGAGSGLAVRASGGLIDAKPLYKNNPPPNYPAIARKRNLEGTVIVLARVSRMGRVLEAKIDQSSGHTLLDSSAVAAVKSWEFEPGKHGNEPIESMVKLPITFLLR